MKSRDRKKHKGFHRWRINLYNRRTNTKFQKCMCNLRQPHAYRTKLLAGLTLLTCDPNARDTTTLNQWLAHWDQAYHCLPTMFSSVCKTFALLCLLVQVVFAANVKIGM